MPVSNEHDRRVSSPAPAAQLLAVSLGDVHPCDEPTGCPEFEVTISFLVDSDDPAVIEAERSRVWALMHGPVCDQLVEMVDSGAGDDTGPFDPDELVQWAEMYGHPEGWAKRAQSAHMRAERAEAKLRELQERADA